MEEIVEEVAKELNLPKEVVWNTYKAFWQFIRETIVKLPLKEDLTKEEFDKLKTNFNLPSLGKLSCTYERWKINKERNDKYKENKANV